MPVEVGMTYNSVEIILRCRGESPLFQSGFSELEDSQDVKQLQEVQIGSEVV